MIYNFFVDYLLIGTKLWFLPVGSNTELKTKLKTKEEELEKLRQENDSLKAALKRISSISSVVVGPANEAPNSSVDVGDIDTDVSTIYNDADMSITSSDEDWGSSSSSKRAAEHVDVGLMIVGLE